MQDLPADTRFIGPPDGRTEYVVTAAASADPDGRVQVRNLSMTDAEAAHLLASPGLVERGCDPRDGFFDFAHPMPVEVLS